MKQKERDATREQVEVALYDKNKELEERVRGYGQLKELFRRTCKEFDREVEEFRIRFREKDLEKERAIRRIEELENKARKKDGDRETVEANLRCEINDLSEKLRTTGMYYKEVEAGPSWPS
jgi:hypothetical protein